MSDSDSENDEMMETSGAEKPEQEAVDEEAEGDDSSDADDSSSSGNEMSEDDNDNKLIQTYIEVLENIDKNKYSYDNYVLLVNIAHEICDLDKIRQSCELFASVYPLAPEIWLKWLKIELNIATTDAEYRKVHQLFRRALSDYYSLDVATEYANLALKSKKVDEIWEELISTYTLHCMKGRAIFEAWRVYFIDKEPESPEKYKKIIQMYEQELSVPLYDMEETYIQFKVICEKQKDKYESVDWMKIDQKYTKAKEHLQKILPFENKLAELHPKSHQDRAAAYFGYIEQSREFLTDQMVQILYERMVTDCCLNAECWLSYVKYIQSRDGYQAPQTNSMEQPLVFSQTDWDVINRAIRNCTWSAEIYVEKMRIAEKMELPKQEVQNIAEFALAAGFQTADPLVTIWLEYLSYLRRNTNYKCEKEVEILRATFTLAWDTLGRQFGVLADCNCEILQMWGRLEYGELSNLAKGKELWTTVMESADNGSKSGLWIEFAHLEMKKGADGVRKVFRKAIALKDEIDDINLITSAWIRFERCNGSLDQLILCQEQCQIRLSKEKQKHNQHHQQHNHQSFGGGRRNFDSIKPSRSLKRKQTTNNDHHSQRSTADRKDKSDFKKPFVKQATIDHFVNSEEQQRPEKGRKSNKNGDGGDESSVVAKRAKLENLADIHDKQQIDTSQDDTTIFLSNLDYNLKSEEITEAFPELNIVNVNIIKSVNGNSRGFAYVQLESATDVEKSLQFDRRLLKGRPAFISSVLRDKEQRKKFKYSEDVEPTKLFVKGLPFEIKKEELEILFGAFGPLKDVRLVYHKSGTPKGIAYIEFEKESSASKAVLKMDQFELKNFKISVAISAPPRKPPPAVSSANQVGLGQGRRSATKSANVGEIKPRMSFIPSAVRKNVLQTKATTVAAATKNDAAADPPTKTETSQSKTNEDFRKLLQK